MWFGRYGGQPWSELEHIPTRVLERRQRALSQLLAEEVAPPTPTAPTGTP